VIPELTCPHRIFPLRRRVDQIIRPNAVTAISGKCTQCITRANKFLKSYRMVKVASMFNLDLQRNHSITTAKTAVGCNFIRHTAF